MFGLIFLTLVICAMLFGIGIFLLGGIGVIAAIFQKWTIIIAPLYGIIYFVALAYMMTHALTGWMTFFHTH